MKPYTAKVINKKTGNFSYYSFNALNDELAKEFAMHKFDLDAASVEIYEDESFDACSYDKGRKVAVL